MQFLKLFSERQEELQGDLPDVYQYETIPQELRFQVIHLLRDAFGGPERDYLGDLAFSSDTAEVYQFIHETLSYHYGKPGLSNSRVSDFYAVRNFFLETKETAKALDVIELSFQYMEERHSRIPPDELIAQLNYWFRRRGVGYQYAAGQIIKVDSEFLHSEVVKPALSMLVNPMYQGVNAEFLSAHEHYRTGKYKECLNDCLKAFESCIKAICKKRRWAYNETDTINRLIRIVFDQGLIPTFMQSHFSGLRSTLEAGVPTARNRQSGHGQGANIITIPEYMASYVLHLTASNILFLAKANEDMK